MKTIWKISQQAGWQVLGKAITSFSTVLILALITRNFGAAETGVLTLALTYLSFFVLIADFGINPHVLPSLLGEKITPTWQRLLGMRILLSAVATILAASLVFFWPAQSELFKVTVWLALLGIVEPGIFVTVTAVFQSRLRYDFPVIAIAMGTLSTLAIVLWSIKMGITLPWLILGYVFGWLVTGLLGLVFVRRFVDTLSPIFDLAYIKRIVSESWPISLTLVLNIVYFRVDSFIISFTRNFAEVGIYNVAFQIFQTLLVVPTFIMNSYYPLMLKNFQQDFNKFIHQIKQASLLLGATAVLGTVLTIVFAPLAIGLITGDKGFAGSITALQILSLSFPAFFLTSILMWTLITLRRYKIMLAIYLVGLAVNGLLNLYYIPQYSYIAASWVTVFCEYLILLLQLVILRRILK